MNKLASIYFLQRIGLPTVNPQIIKETDEKRIRKHVDSFYFDYPAGWALRCAELPDERGRVERDLPWGMVKNKEDLIKKIIEMQKEIKGKYYVFCHLVKEMVRGGTMIIGGNHVVIESGEGGPRELSAMYRGSRNPEERIIFKPGMLSQKHEGKRVLSLEDLYYVRSVERNLNWKQLNAIVDDVSVEFSILKNNKPYVHDVSILS